MVIRRLDRRAAKVPPAKKHPGGRPRVKAEAAKPVSFYLGKSVIAALDQAAKGKGLTRSVLAERLLRRGLRLPK